MTFKTIISIALTAAITVSVTGCAEQPNDIPAADGMTTNDTLSDSDIAITIHDETTIDTGTSVTSSKTEEESESGLTTAATTQTTKPPTTTTAADTKPAPADTAENGKPVVTTIATFSATTTSAAVTTTTKPAVTTTPAPAVTTTTKPAVTTTPAPAVTTQPAPSHTHSYSSKITKEPTCTATGIRTYTCSCGNSYTETISAKGHDWKSETIPHDAVTEERAVTEEWTHVIGYIYFPVTELGMAAGVGTNGRITVKVLEYYVKGHDEANIEWVYRYDPPLQETAEQTRQ